MTRARVLAIRALAGVAVLALAWTAVIWLNGGVSFTLAGTRVTSNAAWRPFVGGLIAAAIAIALRGIDGTRTSLRRIAARITPTTAAIALAIVTMGVSLRFNSWTASGADSFAYVSQAALWREGHLRIGIPLAADVPWPDAIQTFVPFGYHAAVDGTLAIVPMTSPGVPMLMALLQSFAGHAAAFVVTPLSGAALGPCTFAIGRRLRAPAVGLAAAWLVATSPAVLFMLMWPMTDIPAAACSALMLWLLLGTSNASAFGAGLAASAGVLVRPNFVTIVAGAVCWLIVAPTTKARWRRGAAFLLGLLPGALVTAGVNAYLWGSPVASGYGTAGGLLSIGRIATNAAHYGRWLAESSPLALAGLAALAWPVARLWTPAGGWRTASLLLVTVASTLSVYLVYADFGLWWYLRFLLPAWPAIFIAAAVVLDAIGRRGRLARAAVLAVVVAAGIGGVTLARSRGVFNIGDVERRYATVARLVAGATEPDAVILTNAHAGTILYYAGRDIVRFDGLDPAWLDRAIAWLAARGRHPYILVEDWEQPQFETRFAADNALGALSYAPVLAWQSTHTPGWVFLYDPVRRDGPTAQPGPAAEHDQPRSAAPVGFPPSR